MTEKELLRLIVKACDEKRAEDLVVMDLRQLTTMTDYFVIASSSNSRQLEAICDNVRDKLKEENISSHIEGDSKAGWVLLDINSVILHVFSEDERLHYNLEKLWHEAPLLDVEEFLA